MKQVDFFSMIDDYLDNALRGEELVIFENELKINQSLSNELNLHKRINKYIDLCSFQQMPIIDEQKSKHHVIAEKITNIFKKQYIPYVACALIIFSSSFILWKYINQKPYDLYKEYYSRVEFIGNSREVEEGIEAINQQGIYLYYSYRYYSAMNCFKTVLDKDSMKLDALFFSAGAAMETKQFNKAEELLIKVLSYNNLLNEQALWYLSLCYIQEGKIKNAENTLLKLNEDRNNYYYTKAAEILEKLKNDSKE